MNVPKNKKYIFKGVLKEISIIFVISITAFLFIKEVRAQITEVNDVIYIANETNTLRDFYKETYDKYNKDIQNIADAQKAISTSLPPTEDIREFLGVLNTYATKNNVEVNISVGGAQIDSAKYEDIALRTIPITLSVNGQTQNIRSYVGEIEKLPYFWTIISYDEKALDQVAKQRIAVINTKLWTKPEQLLTRMQSQ